MQLSTTAIPAHEKGAREPLTLYYLVFVFTVCSILGLILETIVSYFVDGRWESRVGFIWGPFSPIYGVGGVLITLALHRFENASPLVIYAVSAAFGAAFGMAMPLLFVPSTLLGSFSLVLVPEISENFYREKHEALKADIEKALKACLFVSSLFVPAFFVLGEELGVLIFNSYEGGIYLGHSAYLMFLMSISNISTSILNSMGFETNTLRYFLISAAIMLACIWFLPAAIGVYALLVGFTFVFGLTALFNMRLLNRKSKLPLQYRKFTLVSFLSLLPTALLGVLLKNLLLDVMGNFLTVLVVGGVCVAFQFLFYLVFAREDLKWILEKLSRKKRAKRASAQPTIGTKI